MKAEKMTREKTKEELLPYLLLTPTLASGKSKIVSRLIYNIYISFFSKKLGVIASSHYVGLWNYVNLFRKPLFYKVLKNSLIWTFGSLIPHLLIGLLLAVVLNQKLKIARVARSIIVLPWVVPGVVAANIWRLIFHADFGMINDFLFRMGLIDSYQAWLGKPDTAMLAVIIANIWKGVPFYVILFYAGLQAIPNELYEAAKVDGANMWQNFVYITLPQLKSVISIAAVLAFMWSWNFFDLIYVMTQGGPVRATENMPIYIYSTSFLYYRMSEAAAISFLLFFNFFIMFILYYTLQKRA